MFFSLPVEIQRQCIDYLDTAALKSTRLTSRALKDIATEALFEAATIQFAKKSQERLTGLFQKNELRRYIRQINLGTQYDMNCIDNEYCLRPAPCWWMEACSEWGTAELPTLKKLMLDLAYECANRHCPDRHCSALRLAFDSFMLAANIETITVKHHQDTCEAEWPDLAQIRTKPKKLHLLITTWSDDASYDYEIELRHRHAFFNVNLTRLWLDPTQNQLTHLSLHCNTYWGIYPQWHPSGLHFPHLKSMSFAQWTIAYDWQVGFITLHGHTLEQLILTNCPILYALCMTRWQVNNLWQQSRAGTGRGKPPTTNIYSDLRWHTVLPKLTAGLPKLKHFSMGRGPTKDFGRGHEPFDDDKGFEDRYKLSPQIDCSRYARFDYDRGTTEWEEPISKHSTWSSWLEWEHDKETKIKERYPDCLQEDQDALEDLLKIARGRW